LIAKTWVPPLRPPSSIPPQPAFAPLTTRAVDTEVVVELAPGIEVVSIITKKSAE
jgi:hypothetical protein